MKGRKYKVKNLLHEDPATLHLVNLIKGESLTIERIEVSIVWLKSKEYADKLWDELWKFLANWYKFGNLNEKTSQFPYDLFHQYNSIRFVFMSIHIDYKVLHKC